MNLSGLPLKFFLFVFPLCTFLLAGCGNSPPREKALQTAKELAHTAELSDTTSIKNLEASRQVLERLAQIRMEAENWRRYATKKLLNYYHRNEMWPDAVKQAELLIDLQPTEPRWYFLKGRALGEWSKVDSEKVDPALRSLKTALDLDPQMHRAKYYIALLLGFRKGEVQKSRRMFRELSFDLQPTSENRPMMRKARFTLGKLEYKQGNVERARDLYKSILEMDKLPPREKFRAHKLLGSVYRSLGQEEMALNSYRQARSLYSGDEKVRRALRQLGGEP